MEFRLTGEPRLSPQTQTRLARTALVLLALVVVLTTLILVLTRNRRQDRPAELAALKLVNDPSPRGDSRSRLCNATSCHLAAALLKETLTGDPCADFYGYVCSGWLHKPSFTSTHDLQRALLSREARSRLRHMLHKHGVTPPARIRHVASTRQLGSLSDDSPAVSRRSYAKAAALYNDCLRASVEHRADVLAEFLGEMGLGFSRHVENPVALALELDLLYNLKTLFDLHRHATWRRPDGRPLLAMSVRPDMEYWRRDRANMRHHDAYEDHVQRYVLVVLTYEKVSNDTTPGIHNVADIVARVVAAEEVVLALASGVPQEDPERYYRIMPLLEHNSSSPKHPMLAHNDVKEAAVGSPAMLAYRGFLETHVESYDLAAYVTWELGRHLGPLADQKLLYGSSEDKCFEAMYTLMPYPTVVPYMEQLESSRGWEKADLVFRDVTEALSNFLKNRGTEIMSTNFNSSLGIPAASELDAFYEDLQVESHSDERPFLHTYLSALSQIRSKELASIAAKSAPHFPVPPPWSPPVQATQAGRASVPLTSLLLPRFGADVPTALNYGGLGLDLATALALHMRLDPSWLECLARLHPPAQLDGDNSIVARRTLAMEAVAEFVGLHSEVTLPRHLPGLESMSEEMLFFISTCVGLCAKGDPNASHQCNLAARNSPRFAKAFACGAGSFMNPEDRCPYGMSSRLA